MLIAYQPATGSFEGLKQQRRCRQPRPIGVPKDFGYVVCAFWGTWNKINEISEPWVVQSPVLMAVDGQKLPFFLALLGHDCTTWPTWLEFLTDFHPAPLNIIQLPFLYSDTMILGDLGVNAMVLWCFMMFYVCFMYVLCMFYVCFMYVSPRKFHPVVFSVAQSLYQLRPCVHARSPNEFVDVSLHAFCACIDSNSK